MLTDDFLHWFSNFDWILGILRLQDFGGDILLEEFEKICHEVILSEIEEMLDDIENFQFDFDFDIVSSWVRVVHFLELIVQFHLASHDVVVIQLAWFEKVCYFLLIELIVNFSLSFFVIVGGLSTDGVDSFVKRRSDILEFRIDAWQAKQKGRIFALFFIFFSDFILLLQGVCAGCEVLNILQIVN